MLRPVLAVNVASKIWRIVSGVSNQMCKYCDLNSSRPSRWRSLQHDCKFYSRHAVSGNSNDDPETTRCR